MTFKAKTIIVFIMVLILTVGIFAGNLLNGQEKAMATSTPTSESDKKTVSVQGEGVVRIVPDIAYVTLGVETSNKAMSVAQEENKTKMNGIMSELKRLGLQDKDIQTQNYNVYPDYQWQNDKNILVGYKVSNQVRVKIINIDGAGKILDAVANKGANIVNDIQFTVSDDNKAYQGALKIALKNAEDKAKVMVGYFGFVTLTPISITEGSQGYYPPIAYDGKAMLESADMSTPVSAGEMEIRAQVSVSFQY